MTHDATPTVPRGVRDRDTRRGTMTVDLAAAALNPRSIVVVGASENPHKVGGRPLLYLKRFGYAGDVYAVNPNRSTVQGLPCHPSVAALPSAPQMAIIAAPGASSLEAVEACAARGVEVAIVMASGFAETRDTDRAADERTLASIARASGMRLVGPNSQGLANFRTGVVASFSTMFLEPKPFDGPVAIISQSGVMSVAPLGLLHRAGIGVRYSLATGNEADVTAPELAAAVVDDPDVRLVLLYLESLRDPAVLADAAERARDRDLPIVAVKAGRSTRGQAAARSHTAALASADRVIDAFLDAHAIHRVNDLHELVRAAPLYLRGWRPRGRRLVVVSNSGAAGVMAADLASDLGLTLPSLDAATVAAVGGALPAFAATQNPVDITTALMHDTRALSKVFGALIPSRPADMFLVALPIAGPSYDIDAMVHDTVSFSDTVGLPVAVTSPLASVEARFRSAGVPVFDNQTEALGALAQLAAHSAAMQRRPRAAAPMSITTSPGDAHPFLHEADAYRWLAAHHLPIVAHRHCRTPAETRAAVMALGPRVAVKACSPDLPHKAQHGLVALHVGDAAQAETLHDAYAERVASLHARFDGVLVASMVAGHEFIVGSMIDPQVGPVVVAGPGGADVEAMDDVACLLPPFDACDVRRALAQLRGMPRGRMLDRLDLDALCDIAVRVGDLAVAAREHVVAIDLNPVIVGARTQGATIVDALVQTGTGDSR